jgi:hypothetical protein
VSIPAELRREMKLSQGRRFWEKVSATECRVASTRVSKRDPVAAIGFVKRHGLPVRTTAGWMKILREGKTTDVVALIPRCYRIHWPTQHEATLRRSAWQVLRKGLVISPVTYLELAPAFEGDAPPEQFLAEASRTASCERFRTRKQLLWVADIQEKHDSSLQTAGLPTS